MYVIDAVTSRNKSNENIFNFAQRTIMDHCKMKCAQEETFIPHSRMKEYGTCSIFRVPPEAIKRPLFKSL